MEAFRDRRRGPRVARLAQAGEDVGRARAARLELLDDLGGKDVQEQVLKR